MIDLHSHILPGVDDGAQTLDDSLELARAAAADGIRLIGATPHVREDYPTPVETMERLVDEVGRAVTAAGIPIELRPGGEIALEQLDRLGIDELRRFGLGGNGAYLLVEFPYYGWPLDLGERLFRLRTQGVTPVLAHPERNGDVQAQPERLRRLVESGALVQLTAASVDGRLGRRAREASYRLLDLELAHMLASDAHTPEIRTVGMAAAASAIGDGELSAWLTEHVPAAIVAGQPLPERPERRSRGRLRLPWRR